LSGSRTWPATAWRTLLELALPAIDELGPGFAWTFGGGTALALKLNHRISYDIDVFFEDAGRLRDLSPNRNRAARALTNRWQEPGHYIKLERDEGEIDFIVAATLTDCMPWVYRFHGRSILVEEPAEILAKKLKYRGSEMPVRDIFDLIAAGRADPASVRAAVEAVPDGARRAADRIRRIARRYVETIGDEVNPTASGAALLEIDPCEAALALERHRG
jgi:hypothetical protein